MSDNIGFSANNQYDIKKLILEDLNGNQWDMRNYMLELNMYHSIFSVSGTGNFTFFDAHDWRSNLPIMGGEKLTFKFKSYPSDNYTTVIFRVKSVKQTVQQENSAIVKLSLVSEEQFKNASINQSLSCDGSYYKAIFNQFKLFNSSKEFDINDPANSDVKFNTLLRSPFDNIIGITNRSYDTDGSPYLFYEDLDGYHFKSLGSMLSGQAADRLLYDPEGIGDDQTRDYKSIRDFEIKSDNFDILRMAQDKIESRREFYFDIMGKSFDSTDRTYSNEFSVGQSLETYPLRTTGTNNKTPVWMHSMDDTSDKFIYNRLMYLDALHSFGLKTVTIASDFLRVGAVYQYNIRSNAKIDANKKLKEEYVSGRFLLTNIKRTFTPSEYVVSSELVKDSLSKEL